MSNLSTNLWVEQGLSSEAYIIVRKFNRQNLGRQTSVSDPFHFDTDPFRGITDPT